jgi:uncharacterized protein (DUF924 family)
VDSLGWWIALDNTNKISLLEDRKPGMHQAVINFWFNELEPKQHWHKDPELDGEIARRFGDTHKQAAAGECWQWRQQALGRLAEVIVLDQFSRNIYRDDPNSFAQDRMALALAQEAVACGDDQKLPVEQRAFLYLPFMHSESLVIHDQAVRLFKQAGMENNYAFECQHHAIIERFGRYPHRNRILGRRSTAEEVVFLKEPGSSF